MWVAVPAALPNLPVVVPNSQMALRPRSELPREVRHSHGKSCCSLFLADDSLFALPLSHQPIFPAQLGWISFSFSLS